MQNLLVPQNSDTCITSEFKHVKKWKVDNKMVINHEKKQKKSFSEGRTSKLLTPPPLAIPGLDQVHEAKLLRVQFTCTLSFTEHVSAVLKLCSQRLHLLKLLRDQVCREIVWIVCFIP